MWRTEIYQFFYREDIVCLYFFNPLVGGGGSGVEGGSIQNATFYFSAFSVSLNVLKFLASPNKISDTHSSNTLLQTQIKEFIDIPMTTM